MLINTNLNILNINKSNGYFIYLCRKPDLKTLLHNQVNKHRYTDSGFDIPLLEQYINENTVRDGYCVQYTFNLGIKVASVKIMFLCLVFFYLDHHYQKLHFVWQILWD